MRRVAEYLQSLVRMKYSLAVCFLLTKLFTSYSLRVSPFAGRTSWVAVNPLSAPYTLCNFEQVTLAFWAFGFLLSKMREVVFEGFED